jgi:hypothetical protein
MPDYGLLFTVDKDRVSDAQAAVALDPAPLVPTRADRVGPQQGRLNAFRFPPVLLEELPHRFPSRLSVGCPYQVAGQIGQGHRAVAGHPGSSLACESLARAYGARRTRPMIPKTFRSARHTRYSGSPEGGQLGLERHHYSLGVDNPEAR